MTFDFDSQKQTHKQAIIITAIQTTEKIFKLNTIF